MAPVRQLAAVMLTDIVDFATLTQQDEAAALRLVQDQENLIRPLVRQHGGREIKTMGDAFLVEFESSLAATQCAIEIQQRLSERNRLPSSRSIGLRIGLHVGDVVRRDDDIYGDTVNILSRIVPTAESGGISVSATVYEQVRNKIDYSFRKLDARPLKHIDLPQTIYRIELPWLRVGSGPVARWTGREPELARVRQKVDATQRGEGGAIVLSGEAGIGKSRLAEEAIRYAEKNGFRVLRGRALPGELVAPYSHWADAVREFLPTAPPQLLYKVCGNYATEISRLVPEVTDSIGPIPPSPSLEAEQARFRFFQGITQFFENLAKEGPLLLVFDELQWADPASLRLLQYAVPKLSRQRFLLLGAFTDSEVDRAGLLQETLHALHREHLLTDVRLSRLDRSATEGMISGLLGGERASSAIVASVYEMTGGNPFYVEEVLRALLEEGIVFRGEDRWERKPSTDVPVPSSVRAVVARRLERLDEEPRNLLRIAAIIGTEFTFESLVGVSEAEESRVVEAIELALQHRLLREQRLSAGRVVYSFTDPQIRGALYDQMSAIRRRRYHRRSAEVLELAAGPRASELAHHYLLGGEVAKALPHALEAARRAAALYAHEEAIRHYETALELGSELRGPGENESLEHTTQRARILQALSEEAKFPGQWALAERSAEEAAQLFKKVGDRAAAGSNLLWAGSIRYWVYRSHEQGLALLLEARDLLEGEPESQLHAKLCLALGHVASHIEFPQLPTSRALYQQALVVARATPAPDIEVLALSAISSIEPLEDPEAVRRELGDALALARQLDLVEGPGLLWSVATTHLFMDANPTAALAAIDEAVQWSRRIRDSSSEMGFEGSLRPFVLTLTGELDRAAEALAVGARFSQEVGIPNPLNHLFAAQLELIRGNLGRASGLIASAKPPLQGSPDRDQQVFSFVDEVFASYVDGWLEQERGDAARALAVLEVGIGICERKGFPAAWATLWAMLLARAVEVSLRLPDAAEAGRRATHLREQLDRIAYRIPVATNQGLALRSRASWEDHRGDLRLAVQSLEESVMWWRKAEWPYELAVTLARLGSACQRSSDPGKAGRCYAEASEIFTHYGAKRDLERLPGSTPGGST